MIHTALNWWEYFDPEVKIRFPYVQANLMEKTCKSFQKYIYITASTTFQWLEFLCSVYNKHSENYAQL